MGRMLMALAVWTALAAVPEGQVGRRLDLLDANTARERDLRAIPELTPALVRAILDARPIGSIRELDDMLQPLTEAQRASAYRRVFVSVNVNEAARNELLLIPGLDDALAARLEERRPYQSLNEVRTVIREGVDSEEAARLEQYLFVPIDLNSATDADILSIPNVGQRMLFEFKEYRPYKSLEQFRREIGKYVSKREVARLERYVTIGARR